MNWMRWKVRSNVLARACASVVFPTPGTSSIRTCPRASNPEKCHHDLGPIGERDGNPVAGTDAARLQRPRERIDVGPNARVTKIESVELAQGEPVRSADIEEFTQLHQSVTDANSALSAGSLRVSDACVCRRRGLSANTASNAVMTLNAMMTSKIAFHEPVSTVM